MALTPADAALSGSPPAALVVASELSANESWGVFLVLRDPTDSRPWAVYVRNAGTHWEHDGEGWGGSLWHSTRDRSDPNAPRLGVGVEMWPVAEAGGRTRWQLLCSWATPPPEW